MYEMLCGEQPFRMSHIHRTGARSVSEWKYQPLREVRSDIPLWLDLAIEKSCHPDIRARHSALSEFWTDLIKPNEALVSTYSGKPLIERHADKVWPAVSAILMLVVILQSWLLLSE